MTTTSIAATEPLAPSPAVPVEGESRFLIYNIDWTGYELLLQAFGSHGPRVSYLDGTIEVMSPGPIHEEFSYILGRMVTILTMELKIPANGLKSMTFKRENLKRGLEPDECFYLTSSALLRGQDLDKLDPFPPPDLVIEVEVTSPLLDKVEIYAGLGVPEIWRHDDQGLTILLLQPNGNYVESSQSLAFPFLPMDEFARQLEGYESNSETLWLCGFRDWVRDVIAPLYQP